MSEKKPKEATNSDKMKNLKTFSIGEVSKHNSPDDCWIILFGKVYDVTKFLEGHPGGNEQFLQKETRDLSEQFEEVGHLGNFSILAMLKSFLIGRIHEEPKPSL